MVRFLWETASLPALEIAGKGILPHRKGAPVQVVQRGALPFEPEGERPGTERLEAEAQIVFQRGILSLPTNGWPISAIVARIWWVRPVMRWTSSSE